MTRKTKFAIGAIAGGAAIAAALGGVAVANTDDDGTEVPITGDALDAATDVALEHTGEGR